MRRFTDILGDLEGGKLVDDLDATLNELVATCRMHRKAGTLTLKIGIVPNGEFSLDVGAKVDVNLPTAPRERTILFAQKDGSLHKNDPRQFELQLRTVQMSEPIVVNLPEEGDKKAVKTI